MVEVEGAAPLKVPGGQTLRPKLSSLGSRTKTSYTTPYFYPINEVLALENCLWAYPFKLIFIMTKGSFQGNYHCFHQFICLQVLIFHEAQIFIFFYRDKICFQIGFRTNHIKLFFA